MDKDQKNTFTDNNAPSSEPCRLPSSYLKTEEDPASETLLT
jgi:hypothetical protein